MVGIGDAHIGRGIRGDVGNHIVVNSAVVGIKPQIDLDVGVERFKIRYRLLVDAHLGHIGIVFGPEGDLIISGGIKFLRHLEGIALLGTVAAGHGQQHRQQKEKRAYFFHPLVPPLATPAMIFFRKIKNSTISGREMTTTAAIIAGIFSRPKPFSRMNWMPLETR